MNRQLLILIWLVGMLCGGLAQTSTSPNEGSRLAHDASTGIYSLYWWARPGNTYFVQHSEDLTNWIYFSDIRTGADAILGHNFQTNADKFFMRLRSSTIPTNDPFNADFDGDHVSNQNELAQGTDPLASLDSDSDGLANDWEFFHGLNPFDSQGSQGAAGDPDGDGIANLQEFLYGFDPVHAPVTDTTGNIVGLRVFTPLE